MKKLLDLRRALITKTTDASRALANFTKDKTGPMGLLNDEVQKSKEYKNLQNTYQEHKSALQRFNKLNVGNKALQKAIKQEARDKIMGVSKKDVAKKMK